MKLREIQFEICSMLDADETLRQGDCKTLAEAA